MTLEQFLNTLKSLGVSKISLEFGNPDISVETTYGGGSDIPAYSESPKTPEIPAEMIDEEF